MAEGFLLTPEMQRQRTTWSGFTDASGEHYCLGIRYLGPLLGHSGDTVSYSVVADYLPACRASIVVLTNTGGGHVAGMISDLASIAFPADFPVARAPSDGADPSPSPAGNLMN